MISFTRLLEFSAFAAVIAFLLFPVLIKIVKQLKWFDAPGSHKIHSEFVPSMGGICILLGAIISLFMSLPFIQWVTYKYFFIAVMLMFLIGLRDDVLALSPRQKLISQFLPVFVMVVLDQVILDSWYGLGGGDSFHPLFAHILTFFTIIIITNAYNLIDGLDGLAGTVGVLALLFFGMWFFYADEAFLGLIAMCFAGAMISFLIFNWQPSKIFMGDTGALTIGIILSYFAIRFINIDHNLPAAHPARFEAAISTAVCVLIIPLFDTLRVIVLRLRRMQSPFHADQNHLHHQFLQLGMNHAQSVLWIGSINAGFIGIAFLLKDQRDGVLLPIVVVTCLLINFVLKWRLAKHAGMTKNA